jgi:hypothetical protein
MTATGIGQPVHEQNPAYRPALHIHKKTLSPSSGTERFKRFERLGFAD